MMGVAGPSKFCCEFTNPSHQYKRENGCGVTIQASKLKKSLGDVYISAAKF
jgi:hypothetical protein